MYWGIFLSNFVRYFRNKPVDCFFVHPCVCERHFTSLVQLLDDPADLTDIAWESTIIRLTCRYVRCVWMEYNCRGPYPSIWRVDRVNTSITFKYKLKYKITISVKISYKNKSTWMLPSLRFMSSCPFYLFLPIMLFHLFFEYIVYNYTFIGLVFRFVFFMLIFCNCPMSLVI